MAKVPEQKRAQSEIYSIPRRDGGQVNLIDRDMSLTARRERGRAFISRYKKTLEVLRT